MGAAHVENKDLLLPGMSCIIEVDSANSPRGRWWGLVVEAEVDGEGSSQYLSIRAKIDGGRLHFDDRLRPIRSDEERGNEPRNYEVYPDTFLVRDLFSRILYVEGELKEAKGRAGFWQKLYHETFRDMVNGVADRIADRVCDKLTKTA